MNIVIRVIGNRQKCYICAKEDRRNHNHKTYIFSENTYMLCPFLRRIFAVF